MSNLRTGSKGTYYGSFIGESNPLSTEQMTVNAKYIKSYLEEKGWTVNAIAGMLGNLQAESTMNPGRWQSESVGNVSMGYGLVQWTPSTKYTEWATSNGFNDYSEMDSNLARIVYEVENNLQWIATNTYSFSFKEFSQSTSNVSELAKAFLLCYERPADQSESVQNYRSELALNWYSVITDGSSGDSGGGVIIKTKKSKFNFLVLTANRRRKQWIKQNL